MCVKFPGDPGEFFVQNDSFLASVTINILCTVFLMSILLTVLGTWIGTHSVTLEPIQGFFYKWPRNFTIAFFVEALVAQPAARRVMFWLHVRKARKTGKKACM